MTNHLLTAGVNPLNQPYINIAMKIKANNQEFGTAKYASPKKPMYYFHADEDFREDREWGKEKGRALPITKLPANKAHRAVL